MMMRQLQPCCALLCFVACRALGLSVSVSGIMGKRTQFQIDAKAQLVVMVADCGRRLPAGSEDEEDSSQLGFAGARSDTAAPDPTSSSSTAPAAAPDGASSGGAAASGAGAAQASTTAAASPAVGSSMGHSELEGLEDNSGVFQAPKLLSTSGEELAASYSGAEQALLLAYSRYAEST